MKSGAASGPGSGRRSAAAEWAVATGPIWSVGVSYVFAETGWGRGGGRWTERWVLDWGVGIFYAVFFLGPLACLRRFGLGRITAAGVLSVLSWHVAVRFASEPYGSGSPNDLIFLGRTILAGALGAAAVASVPFSQHPNWERCLGVLTLVGAMCGGQMALLCLWNFSYGFWLGMLGWQTAVGALSVFGTRPEASLADWMSKRPEPAEA